MQFPLNHALEYFYWFCVIGKRSVYIFILFFAALMPVSPCRWIPSVPSACVYEFNPHLLNV